MSRAAPARRRPARPAVLLVLALLLPALPAAPAQRDGDPAAARMEQKLRHVQQNAERDPPHPAPTVFTEAEVNAYFAAGHVELPTGVQRVRFRGAPGQITADARVDFDEITAGRRAAHPWLIFFTGRHDVTVVAQAVGADGEGTVTVDSVAINGRPIPRAAVEFFVRRYLTPRYPGVGMESRFPLPARIDSATVGERRLTVIQK